jgi:hypothetical protein
VLPTVIKPVADGLERIREEAAAVGLRNVLGLNLHGGTEEYQVKPQYNRFPSGAARDLTSYTETSVASVGFQHYAGVLKALRCFLNHCTVE